MYWLIKTINTPFKLDVALSHIRDALSLIRDDVSSKQEIKQASKIHRFHCRPPMVGLAKARPNYVCIVYVLLRERHVYREKV